MSRLRRYILHPGYVLSSSPDRERHYIGAALLARLYGLKPSDWEIADPNSLDQLDPDRVHLYPRGDGNYNGPLEEL